MEPAAPEALSADPTLLVLKVEEAARRLRIGRTLMYELISSGEVQSIAIGRSRRVPVAALTDYVVRLMQCPNTESAA
ncbi:helix-turn-helix domain-containing protein [Kitasatospora sp. NPDC051914]|uniref:helix-turn-helix domain-containing protein n=1 Tax=Kitasatospora sp. NPDC051914 TaxID=3154945 RepID=UPI0034227C89